MRSTTLRGIMLAVLLVACAALAATHGVRGFAALMVLVLLTSISRTRAWRASERTLVRVTGSRRRAAALVMAVLIAAIAAVNLYGYVR